MTNIKVNVDISDATIDNLLCSAFEGGSTYWLDYVEQEANGDVAHTDFNGDYPTRGGTLLLYLLEEYEGRTSFSLNKAQCLTGLQCLAANFPDHFANILSENDDADTADAFLQCALFGDIIFG